MNPARALRHFGFKQTIKSSLIIGLLAGVLLSVQGFGYVAVYPDQKSRASFAASLQSAPALGILYGESKNLISPAGYMIYRAGPIMALVGSVWGLMAATKLLRGQEEDGRWEIITGSRVSARQATGHVLLGFGGSIILAFLVTTGMAAVAGLSPDINLSPATSLLIALAIFLPTLLFIAIGCVTSQLSVSRRRAVTFGLAPLVVLFSLRSIANSVSDLYWLKNLTPFGWADMISPVISPMIGWVWPFILLSLIAVGISLYAVGKRDLGAGLIRESDHAKPHFFWLGSANQLAARQHVVVFAGWGLAALTISGIIAGISDIAVHSLTDSPSFRGALAKLSGSVTDLKIAFLGAGMILLAMLLLIMIASSINSIRQEEAKTYLDNLLTQPKRRSSWLIGRLVLILSATTIIVLSCGLLTWLIARLQGLSLDLVTMLLVSIALSGTAILTLGIGTFFYGILPRFASTSVYIIVVWSFLIDLLESIVTLNPLIVNSSLFHYIATSPNATPDWATFGWLALIGVVLAIIGTVFFIKRDIVSE